MKTTKYQGREIEITHSLWIDYKFEEAGFTYEDLGNEKKQIQANIMLYGLIVDPQAHPENVAKNLGASDLDEITKANKELLKQRAEKLGVDIDALIEELEKEEEADKKKALDSAANGAQPTVARQDLPGDRSGSDSLASSVSDMG